MTTDKEVLKIKRPNGDIITVNFIPMTTEKEKFEGVAHPILIYIDELSEEE